MENGLVHAKNREKTVKDWWAAVFSVRASSPILVLRTVLRNVVWRANTYYYCSPPPKPLYRVGSGWTPFAGVIDETRRATFEERFDLPTRPKVYARARVCMCEWVWVGASEIWISRLVIIIISLKLVSRRCRVETRTRCCGADIVAMTGTRCVSHAL